MLFFQRKLITQATKHTVSQVNTLTGFAATVSLSLVSSLWWLMVSTGRKPKVIAAVVSISSGMVVLKMQVKK